MNTLARNTSVFKLSPACLYSKSMSLLENFAVCNSPVGLKLQKRNSSGLLRKHDNYWGYNNNRFEPLCTRHCSHHKNNLEKKVLKATKIPILTKFMCRPRRRLIHKVFSRTKNKFEYHGKKSVHLGNWMKKRKATNSLNQSRIPEIKHQTVDKDPCKIVGVVKKYNEETAKCFGNSQLENNIAQRNAYIFEKLNKANNDMSARNQLSKPFTKTMLLPSYSESVNVLCKYRLQKNEATICSSQSVTDLAINKFLPVLAKSTSSLQINSTEKCFNKSPELQIPELVLNLNSYPISEISIEQLKTEFKQWEEFWIDQSNLIQKQYSNIDVTPSISKIVKKITVKNSGRDEIKDPMTKDNVKEPIPAIHKKDPVKEIIIEDPALKKEVIEQKTNITLIVSGGNEKKGSCKKDEEVFPKKDTCKKKKSCKKEEPCKKKNPCEKEDLCKKKNPCEKEDPCKIPCKQAETTCDKKDVYPKEETCQKDKCKKKSTCQKEDPCKKKNPCEKEDPCKKKNPCEKEDSCKKKNPCQKDDPCKKPCKQAETTCDKKDVYPKKEICKKNNCKRKTTCQKEDPCKNKNPCDKEDSCKKKNQCEKKDPCKKKSSCKKEDSCKKKNPCEKKDSCKKKPCEEEDPCAKTNACKKKDSCQKPCKQPGKVCDKSNVCKKEDVYLKDEICKKDTCEKKPTCKKEDACKKKNSCEKNVCQIKSPPGAKEGPSKKPSKKVKKDEDVSKKLNSFSPKKSRSETDGEDYRNMFNAAQEKFNDITQEMKKKTTTQCLAKDSKKHAARTQENVEKPCTKDCSRKLKPCIKEGVCQEKKNACSKANAEGSMGFEINENKCVKPCVYEPVQPQPCIEKPKTVQCRKEKGGFKIERKEAVRQPTKMIKTADLEETRKYMPQKPPLKQQTKQVDVVNCLKNKSPKKFEEKNDPISCDKPVCDKVSTKNQWIPVKVSNKEIMPLQKLKSDIMVDDTPKKSFNSGFKGLFSGICEFFCPGKKNKGPKKTLYKTYAAKSTISDSNYKENEHFINIDDNNDGYNKPKKTTSCPNLRQLKKKPGNRHSINDRQAPGKKIEQFSPQKEENHRKLFCVQARRKWSIQDDDNTDASCLFKEKEHAKFREDVSSGKYNWPRYRRNADDIERASECFLKSQSENQTTPLNLTSYSNKIGRKLRAENDKKFKFPSTSQLIYKPEKFINNLENIKILSDETVQFGGEKLHLKEKVEARIENFMGNNDISISPTTSDRAITQNCGDVSAKESSNVEDNASLFVKCFRFIKRRSKSDVEVVNELTTPPLETTIVACEKMKSKTKLASENVYLDRETYEEHVTNEINEMPWRNKDYNGINFWKTSEDWFKMREPEAKITSRTDVKYNICSKQIERGPKRCKVSRPTSSIGFGYKYLLEKSKKMHTLAERQRKKAVAESKRKKKDNFGVKENFGRLRM